MRILWTADNEIFSVNATHTRVLADGQRLVSDGVTVQEELNKVCAITA